MHISNRGCELVSKNKEHCIVLYCISRYSHIVGNDISSVNSLAVMNEISLMRRQQKCLPHIKC